MNYEGAIQTMMQAAYSQSEIPIWACRNVINTIMAHYMVTSDYYLEDAVETFNHFIHTMTIVF